MINVWQEKREKREGQNEFLLRAMPERYAAAVDIVRSGETAERYGLGSAGILFYSQPGLWQTLPYSDSRDEQVNNVSQALRERLKPLIEKT